MRGLDLLPGVAITVTGHPHEFAVRRNDVYDDVLFSLVGDLFPHVVQLGIEFICLEEKIVRIPAVLHLDFDEFFVARPPRVLGAAVVLRL